MLTAIALKAAPLILATAEEGAEHGAEVFSDGGVVAQLAWLIPVVPMVMAFLIVFFGKRSPLKGWGMAVGTMGFVALYGIVLFGMNLGEGITYQGSVWLADIGTTAFGTLSIEWGWMVDGLSIMMYFVVGVVGLLVFIYAKGYMHGDIRYTWFFASFTLFAGGMLVLVSAPNLIQLIVGWELVGVASWLLIGHYWEEHENSSAAIKAFLTNKVADAALFIGAIIVGLTVGSFRFTDIMSVVAEGGPGSALARYGFWAGLALFIGAMGKSAQFPLHVWLPDAMAGPTPVSALMHAATMVTAGVYLHRPDVPVLPRGGLRRRGAVDHHRHRRHHAAPHGPHRARARRHQEGAGVLDAVAARVHGDGDGGRRLHGRAVPPVHPRVLQGTPVPRGRVGDPRRALQQHVRHGWTAQIHATDLLDLRHRFGSPRRDLPACRLLVEGRDPRLDLICRICGVGIHDGAGRGRPRLVHPLGCDRRRLHHRLLHDAGGLAHLLR